MTTIEEKAKAYDEAIERAKSKIKNDKDHVLYEDDVIEIFPELAESEDERIRKIISDILLIDSDDIREILESNNVLMQDIDAWLEKQGEHANFRNKIQIGDKVTRNEDGVLVNLSQLKRVARKDEKQGEQKTAEWSEEDEKMLDYALDMIEWYSVVDKSKSKRVNDWLKFLKDRVRLQNLTVTDEELAQAKKEAYNDALNKIEYHSGEPTFDDGWSAAIWYLKKKNMQLQPKQEWSEEDNIMIHDIDYALRCQIIYPISRLQSMSAWILNLKNRVQLQSQWKPSDEHMDALRYVTNFDYGGYKVTLVSLYEQLKRLKEK